MTQHTKQRIASGIIYLIIFIFCVLVIAPIAWFGVTSLKTPAKVVAYPPSWIPSPVTLINYVGVLRGSNMPRYFLNSLVVAGSTIVVTLLLASHVSYAAARFNFPLKNTILFLILATSMIPGICILPSLYMIQDDFKNIIESEFNKMIESAISKPAVGRE